MNYKKNILSNLESDLLRVIKDVMAFRVEGVIMEDFTDSKNCQVLYDYPFVESKFRFVELSEELEQIDDFDIESLLARRSDFIENLIFFLVNAPLNEILSNENRGFNPIPRRH